VRLRDALRTRLAAAAEQMALADPVLQLG